MASSSSRSGKDKDQDKGNICKVTIMGSEKAQIIKAIGGKYNEMMGFFAGGVDWEYRGIKIRFLLWPIEERQVGRARLSPVREDATHLVLLCPKHLGEHEQLEQYFSHFKDLQSRLIVASDFNLTGRLDTTALLNRMAERFFEVLTAAARREKEETAATAKREKEETAATAKREKEETKRIKEETAAATRREREETKRVTDEEAQLLADRKNVEKLQARLKAEDETKRKREADEKQRRETEELKQNYKKYHNNTAFTFFSVNGINKPVLILEGEKFVINKDAPAEVKNRAETQLLLNAENAKRAGKF